jgi:hypothetical protein
MSIERASLDLTAYINSVEENFEAAVQKHITKIQELEEHTNDMTNLMILARTLKDENGNIDFRQHQQGRDLIEKIHGHSPILFEKPLSELMNDENLVWKKDFADEIKESMRDLQKEYDVLSSREQFHAKHKMELLKSALDAFKKLQERHSRMLDEMLKVGK